MTPADLPTLHHLTRPAMGTLVGVTVASAEPEAAILPKIDAAFAEIGRWESLLSEWQAGSLTARLNAGPRGCADLPPEADALFLLAGRISLASGGAFSLVWQGGRLWQHDAGVWCADGGPVGLGGILKGFLVDRAILALEAAGEHDFLIDAAGDIGARGDAPGQPGWPVRVGAGLDGEGAGGRTLRLRDRSISTSDQRRQPGHIVDPRTGAPVDTAASVTVIAPTGAEADGLATAMLACGCRLRWPETSVIWQDRQ